MDNGEYIKMRDKVNTLIDNAVDVHSDYLPDPMQFGILERFEVILGPAMLSITFYGDPRDGDIKRLNGSLAFVYDKINEYEVLTIKNISDAVIMYDKCSNKLKGIKDELERTKKERSLETLNKALEGIS